MIKHPQQYYFEVSKVLPSQADGREVLAFHIKRALWETVRVEYLQNWTEWYSHWMQMPKAPSDQHEHAFLE
ncbi:hypothetical protein pf16_228 [Pseudomonas phage pf16]|uniref:Uncharacterized protein n=1 Tax=Pseudomonas phage pf16 TaxID=1815630 RepID=A0A1S5R405_9CAUD|nr:hypothetical protein FDG98_gp070 [Pseudomonas phage pf16]AND75151.1 hypothetical protein pf16_228 [Pseudomonas phage pf16]